MSTPETDLYWAGQDEIFQSFCSLVDGTSYEVGEDAIQKMRLNPDVHKSTLAQCELYLMDLKVFPPVEREEDEDDVAYAKERENDRVESHLYPSEGHSI
jgi:hypothetical protein